ncbi:MAG: hypothetical protein EOL97_05100 [Spirochaetia bacterium]|nr:hypothetical protein [Spirochaetia bacterium]
MARIKSAWEIALEKTESLNIDVDKINKNNSIKLGRRICGLYLNDIDYTLEKFKKEYNEAKDKAATKEGIVNNLLINLTLPSDLSFESTLDKINDIISEISDNSDEIINTINQVKEFFKQYLNHQDDLVNQMKEQFAPVLQQKEAQLQQQYGPDFRYSAEQDSEFMKLLDDNLKRLDQQYNETLDNVKEKIKQDLL